MTITRISLRPFLAKVTFGLNRGYTDDVFSKEVLIETIQSYQNQLIAIKGIYLSVSVSETIIVLNHQKESHVVLNFINYPKFPLSTHELKSEIEDLVKHLMNIFEQNRIVIEYLDETVMLECSSEIDPNVMRI